MKLQKFELFIKLMMMTSSSSDGECLAAIRKANNLLAEANNNWEDLIRGKIQVTAGAAERAASTDPTVQKAPPQGSYTNAVEIEHMIEALLDNLPSGSSFHGFVTRIEEWWQDKGFLTERQYQALKKGYSNL